MTYLALLRGINVGGKNLISMADLRLCFEEASYKNVRTFIQTGNIFFETPETNVDKIESDIKKILTKRYKVDIGVVVFTRTQWQALIAAAPKTWGKDPAWKHNLLIMIRPFEMKDVLKAIGELKPTIETIHAGKGVLYQSFLFTTFGRTTSSKMISTTVYKQMTIRNFTTATKLATKFDLP